MKKTFGRHFADAFGSLRLTVALLVLSMLLIFAATLDQVHLGVWGVQEKYFHAFFVFTKISGTTVFLPIFPGGYLLGGLLLINLIVAHVCRFRLTLAKSGIWLTHLGLILLLLGEGISGALQRDGQIRLNVGSTQCYVESFRSTELAVVDATDPAFDEVIAIPTDRLVAGASVQQPRMPFLIKPIAYYPNARLRMRNVATDSVPSMATVGAGTALAVEPAALTAKEGESNWPTAFVELTAPEGSLGIWLVSTMLAEPQTFSYQGRTWRLSLRPRRDYLPFSLTLLKFEHEIYPGTDIPKNFASTVRLRSPDGEEDRVVRIFMNSPLRYGGFAFYQAGFDNNDRTSVFQAVRNPGWTIPYLSCGLIVLGLVLQFGMHLLNFMRRRAPSTAVLANPRKVASGDQRESPLSRLRHLPSGVLILALLWLGSTFIPTAGTGEFDVAGFGRLPLLADGRIKPMDTVARTALLMFQGRQRLTTADGHALGPIPWLLDVFFRPAQADAYPCFRIDSPDVLSIFGLTTADGVDGVRFSFRQLESGLAELDRQAQLAEPVDASARTAFQREVVVLRERLESYGRLKFSLQSPDRPNFATELSDSERLISNRTVFAAMDTFSPLRVVPPPQGGEANEWQTVGHNLAAAKSPAEIASAVRTYAALGDTWRGRDVMHFNNVLHGYLGELSRNNPSALRRCGAETLFNRVQPFYSSMILYVAAFLVAVFSWLKWPDMLARIAFNLTALAFAVATAGIAARMWLEGRPPVTNLYSSALFIGWGAAALCLLLERAYRNGIATAAGALIGFGTLVIAHHLSLSGDTLEMMRAVLDSNFWLSTHVVTVTTGYASTFLAGFLAVIYLLRRILTRSLDEDTANSLSRMVYGIVCFATLFSFVGTVLGGIWADQSWGRFWGWDPKENGALLIVIWNAVILHVRWAGLAKRDGLMALAVFGNVVTAWSWFGTNMLGVGLHSYGFTDAAFKGLIAFVASQLVVIGLLAFPRSQKQSPVLGTA